jgi:hypothetical protein
MLQLSTYEIVPEIMGGWPPAADVGKYNQLYAASMLLLFMPWRKIHKLKNEHHCFLETFREFKKTMPKDVERYIHNIQAYYECGADARQMDYLGFLFG